MNILVIHEAHYASKIVYEFQIVPELLVKQGHDIHIIDYPENWKEGKGLWLKGGDKNWDKETKTLKRAARAYADSFVTVVTPGILRIQGLARLSYFFSFAWWLRRLLKTGVVDGIILYGMPTVGLQTWILSRFSKGPDRNTGSWRRVPVLYRCIDATSELASKRPILRWLCDKIERFLYPKLRISCTTPAIAEYVKARGGKNPSVVPSGVDCEMFKPCGNAHGSTVLFMGTLYKFSGLDRLIRDFYKVINAHPNARLLIAGDGEAMTSLQKLATDLNYYDYVTFLGRVPYDELPALISHATICINPFELNGITEPIFPTKLLQYMACGKPVVMTELPGTKAYFGGPPEGVVYCSLDVMAPMIARLLSQPEYLKELGENAHRTAQAYDWNAIAATIKNCL